MSATTVPTGSHLRETSPRIGLSCPVDDARIEISDTTSPFSPPPERSKKRSPASHRSIAPREYGYRISLLLLVGDWLTASAAILSGLLIREWQIGVSPFHTILGVASHRYMVGWSLAAGGLLCWFMLLSKSYELENLFRIQRCLKNLLRAVLLWSLAIWAGIGLFRIEGFTPRIGAIYCMIALAVYLTSWRLAAFVVLANSSLKRAASFRVLVIGWSDKAARLRNAMQMDLAELGDIVGHIKLPFGAAAEPPDDLECLGTYADLAAIVREYQIDSIVLADVTGPSVEIQRLIRFCQKEMIGFQMVPDYFPALNSSLQVQTVSGVPLLGVNQLPLDRTLNRAFKRTLDIVGSIVGLAFCAVILPWFCAIVFIESPGPVIFRQRRTSRSGRSFFIYKIRSMRLDAELKTGAVWCKKEDPRRLRIGTFMRRWNIDELPQFFNVLKGDMSLVGPRPERPELIERFKDEIPNYNARHEVRAGVTGWAQIHGWRGDTDLGKRIEADLYYLENWSIMLDLYCLVATFFRTKNAH